MPKTKFAVTLRAYDEVYREIKVEVEADTEEQAGDIAHENDCEGVYDDQWTEQDYVAYDGDGVHVEHVERIEPAKRHKRSWTPAVVEGGAA